MTRHEIRADTTVVARQSETDAGAINCGIPNALKVPVF